jgi:hypothetical protein
MPEVTNEMFDETADFDLNEMSVPPTNGSTTDIDLSELYVPQGVSEGDISAEKILTNVPIRKAKKAEFVRSHPNLEYRREFYLYEDRDGDGAFYVVSPRLVPEISAFVAQYLVVLCVNSNDVPFFFPVKLSDSKMNAKHKANAQQFVELTKTKWTRRTWNEAASEHDLFVAKNMSKEPTFPDEGIEELLKLAIRGGIITSADHPLYKKLLGEM